MAFQAIETKYIGPSNTKGSRIKASCQRGSITISYNDGLSSENAHIEAIEALCRKFAIEDQKEYGSDIDSNPWLDPKAYGWKKDESGLVAVYVPADIFDGEVEA